jgi:hypothetical protein
MSSEFLISTMWKVCAQDKVLYKESSSSDQQTTPILYFLFLLKRDLKVGRSQ